MDGKEIILRLREYNKTLGWCSPLEREYINYTEERDFFWGFPQWSCEIEHSVEEFIQKQDGFTGLLKEGGKKLCTYLRHIQEYTCNDSLIRMDVRSRDFARYSAKIQRAVGAFYIFCGCGMFLKSLIYGEYRDSIYQGLDFSPVIAAELLEGNEEAEQLCRDVLLSENNTAVLTRDVIIAIEQSHNAELKELLLKVFLAAKLQEGLRQSVAETADENTIGFFQRLLSAIEQEDLLRFSSIQRAVMTWIGIGYEEAKEKDVRFIFRQIRLCLEDETKRREVLLYSENPLEIYLSLYCAGVTDMEKAVEEAVGLLADKRRYVVAAALIYLKMTWSFDVEQYVGFTEQYKDDEWIRALYFSECIRQGLQKKKFSRKDALLLYSSMEEFLKQAGTKKTYLSKGFEWFSVSVDKDGLCRCMYDLLEKYPDTDLPERYLPHVASSLYGSRMDVFMEKYFPLVPEEKQKQFLLREIISANQDLGRWAEKKYLGMKLTEQDLMDLEGRLKSKKSRARAGIVNILAAQDAERIRESLKRLSASDTKQIRDSAQELLLKARKRYGEAAADWGMPGDGAGTGRPAVKILGREEGFGLYKPGQMYSLPYASQLQIRKTGILNKKDCVDTGFLLPWDKNTVLHYISLWNDRITQHENEEYYSGQEYCQVKDQRFLFALNTVATRKDFPLGKVWDEYFETDRLGPDVVFQIRFLIASVEDSVCLEKLITDAPGFYTLSREDVERFTYFKHFAAIFRQYFRRFSEDPSYPEKALAFLHMFAVYSRERSYRRTTYRGMTEDYAVTDTASVTFMKQELKLDTAEDEAFRRRFPVLIHLYNNFNLRNAPSVQRKPKLDPMALSRAALLRMVPRQAVYEGILDTHQESLDGNLSYSSPQSQLFEAYRDAYFEGRGTWGSPRMDMDGYRHIRLGYQKEVYEYLRSVLDEIGDRLVSMECGRLNEKSPVTDYVRQLRVIRGVRHVAQALHVLREESLRRENYGDDKEAVFSNVIRHCYPMPDDDPQILVRGGFDKERLVETAMLAPQWIDTVNTVLGWDGFREGCYYFIAHMKEDGGQKKAEIAHYTELDPEELNDGAFDMQWCRRVYELLGEKRFGILYKASRFLCANAFHTRGRKYADACLGKTGKETWRAQAQEKRNKDALNAYCICPIHDDEDLMERYLYIQQFLKESRQYGAQRQAAEKRAAQIAVLNLARNSRFQTVTRLTWMMESRAVSEKEEMLKPKRIEVQGSSDEVEAWIEISDQGESEIRIRKNGKIQKTVPAAVKKTGAFQELAEVHKRWKEQYRRSRAMLEQAMNERTAFSREELEAILSNPIAAPMARKLVLIGTEGCGFFREGCLSGPEGSTRLKEPVRIAHPYDLYERGCWVDFQKMIFDEKIVQPFKQVFRELYLKLDEEMDTGYSRRYSGYQIQVKKAAGALKSRKWNLSYENGLERVFYRENLVVNLFADADWFSPSDIESPSIDYVEFSDRRSGKEVPIRDVDAVVFSEVMRDIDLAVSTAYAGGVDPITSFSTMELRRSVAEYTCRLMKLDNVTIRDHFADIHGTLNDYSVHLGSGVIHQSGGAAIYIIPIHSAKRGKVYLPFLDEDPKTAEILSKIVMLAEDRKIKDPAVLSQIRSRQQSRKEE